MPLTPSIHAAAFAALLAPMVFAIPVTGALDQATAPSAATSLAPAKMSALTTPPFSRYQLIIERKPFGVPPPPPAQPPQAVDPGELEQAKEQEQLARQINMVAVNKTPSGKTAVGFVDKSEKPERNYYISVGETVNGYTITTASYEDETATLQKEEVTITLKLGQGLVKSDQAASTAPGKRPTRPLTTARNTPTTRRRTPVRTPPLPAANATRVVQTESFRARLLRQRAEREAAAAARQKNAELAAQARAEKITKEELDKAKREINLNLIRQGMKPISPIELTPAEDAEMVRLGVLDAQ